ncbi:diguanylate cyclase (GGDEF)-like protein [Robbsia andropogonis]|uniref:EAL domain-containing protein n=1 Tax=Robbsia andropogonis TaxID=28092 RepID=UPI0006974CA2|nr:EAL domain-containing protein [Robbsia andropogonis]
MKYTRALRPDHFRERVETRGARSRLTDTHILLPIFCLILLAVGWLSVYRLLRVEEVAASRAAMQNVRELSDTYEAQLQRNLVYIDQTLRMLEFNVKQSPHTRLRDYEKRGLLPPSVVFALAISDAHGIVRDSNGEFLHDGNSIADRFFFTSVRARSGNPLPPVKPTLATKTTLDNWRDAVRHSPHNVRRHHADTETHKAARDHQSKLGGRKDPRAHASTGEHATMRHHGTGAPLLRRTGLNDGKLPEARARDVTRELSVDASADENPTAVTDSTQDPSMRKGQVTFTRALHNAAGGFVGVVVLCVDKDYFTSGYDDTRMGEAGMLLLADNDARVRAARIGSRTDWNNTLIDNAAANAIAHLSDEVTLTRWGDGILRFTSVRALHDFPLTAVVGLSADEQMAGYRASRQTYLLSACIASIALALLTATLTGMSWQLARSRRNTRRIQRTYFAASEASLDGFVVLRTLWRSQKGITAFIITAASGRATQLLGESQMSLIGRRIDPVSSNLCGPDGYAALTTVAITGQTDATEWLHHRADGTQIWLHRQVVRLEDGLVSIIRDISAQKLTDVRRVQQNRLLEMIATSTPLDRILAHLIEQLDGQLENARCAILLCSEDGSTMRVGAIGELPVAYYEVANGAPVGPRAGPGGRAIHFRKSIHVSRATDAAFDRGMTQCGLDDFTDSWAFPVLAHSNASQQNGGTSSARGDNQAAHPLGPRPLAALVVFSRESRHATEAELDAIGAARRLIGIAVERSEVERTIRHMAKHDALTGLPNRLMLSERLVEVLAQARQDRSSVTIVFIDLDNFKLINDSLGHHAGDTLLKTIAKRMTAALDPADMVARLGGDEFVLVLCAAAHDGDGLASTIAYVRTIIAEPVQLLNEEYRVSASIGSARFPEDGDDTQALLMNADSAMYRAKENGRNTWCAYTAEMNSQAHEKLRLKEALGHALDGGELRLVYQPQVDLAASRVVGMEALLRWHHPRHGVIMPAAFIPFAEENGLIVPIGAWVLETACRQNKAWQDAGYPSVIVSVNVSARQFADDGLVKSVAEALRRSGLDPGYLELEITESVIMLDVPRAVSRMRVLQQMGVRLSIDDFGTGYSSLSALKSFPIARLKLDQSFVRGVTDNKNDQTIARAVVALCRQLNLEVIAEGVETPEQLAFLMENGCSAIQGFWFSKPLDVAEAGVFLSQPFRTPIPAMRFHKEAVNAMR